MKIKLSEYVFRFIADQGVKHVFMVPGGGAMHLNDAVGQNKDIELVSNHHEQASMMAAETYARISDNIGVALVTTGPGGTNAITGVAGAWLDSTPCMIISGQVKRGDLIGDLGVRQNGVQELDIVTIVKSITKYAVMVLESDSIRYHLEKAMYLATSGRPGPVWIDIPLDVQASIIETDSLTGFDPRGEILVVPSENLASSVAQTIKLLNKSERPILLIGNGVRLAGAHELLPRLGGVLNIPVLLTWPALDLLPDTHELLVGRPGPVAPRGANFALQNADCLLSIGARLDTVVTGYSHTKFARAARKIMVDIDSTEIKKMKTTLDVPVCADAKEFIKELIRQSGDIVPKDRKNWMNRCAEWKKKYPIVLPEYRTEKRVSTYVLSEVLSEELSEGDLVISGSSGSGIEIFLLAFKAKAKQRVLCTTALGSMGNGLPASIGACLAGGRRRTVCVCGDGCLQLNIQEFETIKRLQLPVKLFVLNNQGYSSIRISQLRYFSRLTGADFTSGLSLPDACKIAAAYGLPTMQITNQNGMRETIREIINGPGPMVCDVHVPLDEPRVPSMMSMQKSDGSMVSKPLEDLWPFLDRDEFRSNMIIQPLED